MIGWTLTHSGVDPTVVLGAAAPQLGGRGRLGAGPHVVVEAGADGGHAGVTAAVQWSWLAPRLAVLLDPDGTEDHGKSTRVETLQALVASVPGTGLVLARAGSETVESALGPPGLGPEAPVEWLSLERGAAWWGADFREDRGRFRFRIFHRGRFVTELQLQVPGMRPVWGALAAVAAGVWLNLPAGQIQQALQEFTGIAGDFESRGSYRGVTLVNDRGASPAAVVEALRLGRRVFGDRRIWAVLPAPEEPVASRTRERYAAALALADEVVLAGRGRGTATDSEDALDRGTLAGALAAAGMRARSVASLDLAILELDRHLEPGDVLVTLGAGDVGTISDAFIRRLPRVRPGR
jgi:UDP-N-acetylmuramate--alanine ligase